MKTKRFFLKRLSIKNANSNYLQWFDNVQVKQFILGSKNKISIDSLKKFIRYNNNKKNTLLLGIFNKNNKHIGNIKFDKINKNQAHVNINREISKISWVPEWCMFCKLKDLKGINYFDEKYLASLFGRPGLLR